MADLLAGINDRFILSLNDVPEVRSTFAAFHLTEVQTTYKIGAVRNDPTGSRAKLLIRNWSL